MVSTYGADVVFVDISSIRTTPLQSYGDFTQSLIVDHDLTDVLVQLQPKPSQ